MIIGNGVKLINVDRDSAKGLYLHLYFDIIESNGSKIKTTIYLDNEEIYKDNSFHETPYNDCNIIYLNKNSLPKTTSEVKISMENEDGIKTVETYTVNNFNVNFVKRENSETFIWQLDNFSDMILRSNIEIYDNTGNLVITTPLKDNYQSSILQNKKEYINLSSLNEGIYSFFIIINAEGKRILFPNEDYGYRMNLKTSRIPKSIIQSAVISKNGDNFDLYMKAIFRDEDMDKIRYSISDSNNILIYERGSYKFSPSMENIIYSYSNRLFNRLIMKYTTTVSDIYTMYSESTYEIKLFGISNLRRERKRLYWEYYNYSNVRINMQVEVLDFKENIIYQGDIITKLDQKDKITITDDKIVNYFINNDNFEYYKFRLKVWSEAENYLDYYQFKNGTTFVPLENNPPEVKIIEGSLGRNKNGEKVLNLKVFIDDKDNDKLEYTIYDDEMTPIHKSNNKIQSGQTIDISFKYDYFNRLRSNITLTVYDEFEGITSDSITVKTYNIKNLNVKDGYLFSFDADNLSEKSLMTKIEVLDLSGNQIAISEPQEVGNTIDYKNFKFRWLPKKEGLFKYRLIAYEIDELGNEIWKEYYPNEEGQEFNGALNLPPSIAVNSCSYSEIDLYNMQLNIVSELSDPNLDRITYLIKLQINEQSERIIKEQKELKETPISDNTIVSYNKLDITRLRLPYSIEAIDEEGLKSIYSNYINLYNVSHIFNTGNKFHFAYRIFINKNLKGRIEILDENGVLYGCGETKSLIGGLEIYNHDITKLDLNNYEEGSYYYRVKIWSEDEKWNEYYPNQEGIFFNIKRDNPPIVTNYSVSKDNTNIIVECHVQDEGTVTYIIEDDITQ